MRSLDYFEARYAQSRWLLFADRAASTKPHFGMDDPVVEAPRRRPISPRMMCHILPAGEVHCFDP
jgi:hypothetical protein